MLPSWLIRSTVLFEVIGSLGRWVGVATTTYEDSMTFSTSAPGAGGSYTTRWDATVSAVLDEGDGQRQG
jgi:hypothetical protein